MAISPDRNPAQSPREDSAFHCSSEWHMARLPPICAIIHPFALRLSTSGVFCASAVNLANYFGYEERTVRRGLDALTREGFLEVVEKRLMQPTTYRVSNHRDWATKHPGRCATKIEYPWSGEGDVLGQMLSARTAFKVKFLPFQTKNLRSLGLPDEALIERFDGYYAAEGKQKKAKNVVSGFYLWLRADLPACSKGGHFDPVDWTDLSAPLDKTIPSQRTEMS